MKLAIIPKPKLPAVIKRLFEKPFSLIKGSGIVPSTNISNEEKAFEMSIALPGFEKNEIDIRIDNRYLTICAQKQNTEEDKSKGWIRREFNFQKVQRTFVLPDYADEDKVQAELKNGILTVRVAKKAEAIGSRRIVPIK